VGTRDNYETVARIMQAFVRENTWAQKALARHVGVEVPALRRVLADLAAAQMPLEREEDHPHVYWSVRKKWFPGGVIFDAEDWQVLVHAVLRITDKERREKLLRRLLSGRHSVNANDAGLERLSRAVAATPVTTEEHDKVLLIEQALLESVPLAIYYYSASSGRLAWRVISPQRLLGEVPARMVAVCHETNQLRWFRIDNIQRARLETDRPPQNVESDVLEAFLASSVDGFNDGRDEVVAFQVRHPESNWVRGNLLPGMAIDSDSPVLRVVCRGAALVVARFVVGLGGAAVGEGEGLRALVRQLAKDSLEANR
jgi:predicted DNA-binding transcriptional regulator YafY